MAEETALVGNVLTRLEEHFTQEPQIKKSAGEIGAMLDEFYHRPEDAQLKLKSKLYN